MLVLTRKLGERLQIGPDIELVVVRIGPNEIRLGIEAPNDFTIVRGELDQPVMQDGPSQVALHKLP